MKFTEKLKLWFTPDNILKNPFLYLLIIGSMMGVAAYMKHDNLWDLQNYHYNNAFAFLNDNMMQYFVPSGANTFFNPLMDLPLYFLIQHFNDSPSLIYAIQGIWGGLLLCAVVKISLLFYDRYTLKTLIYTLVLLATAACGRVIFRQTGMSTNEIPIAAMDLWCIYFLFKMLKNEAEQKWFKWLLLGIGMGCALGLKQNSVVTCFGTGMALICCYKHINKAFESIYLFAIGGFIGYLITNGYFMYQYWILYDNPFFPFLNNIFQSPYFDVANYNDESCLPKLSWELFHRYLLKSTNVIKGCENIIREDYRLDIYSVLSFLILLYVLISRKAKAIYQKYPLYTFLFLLFILIYAAWFFMFSVLRYTAILEALGAVLLVETFRRLAERSRIFILIFAVITITMFGSWEVYLYRGPFRYISSYIDLEPIRLPQNTLVKFYGSLTSFMIPEFAKYNKDFKSVTHYGWPYNGLHSDCAERGKFRKMRDQIEQNHEGPVVVVFNKNQYIGRNNYDRDTVRNIFFESIPDTGLRRGDIVCDILRHNGALSFYICGSYSFMRRNGKL